MLLIPNKRNNSFLFLIKTNKRLKRLSLEFIYRVYLFHCGFFSLIWLRKEKLSGINRIKGKADKNRKQIWLTNLQRCDWQAYIINDNARNNLINSDDKKKQNGN